MKGVDIFSQNVCGNYFLIQTKGIYFKKASQILSKLLGRNSLLPKGQAAEPACKSSGTPDRPSLAPRKMTLHLLCEWESNPRRRMPDPRN